jgi:hypothetical protein
MGGKSEIIEHPNAKTAKWIIPPGLGGTIEEFLFLYECHFKNPKKRMPLMIMGDPGAGKSLFIHIFKTLYEKDNPGKKITRINIAAFTETLITSELFGHKKGSFTDATQDKPGLVVDTDLLILEEIGDIKPDIQAKLLTFIEDGFFYSVGDTKEKRAKETIQIIATTNKTEKEFRRDFYDRFFKFSIPAIHQRRSDIFTHFLHSYPYALTGLRPWECMSLLAHHWPGNVREIETIGKEIHWKKLCRKGDEWMAKRPILPFGLHDTQTAFRWEECRNFYNSLKINGVDVAVLEKVLNNFDLGIDPRGDVTRFSDPYEWTYETNEKDMAFDKQFNTITWGYDERHNKFYEGLSFYCSLFLISPSDNRNLFYVRESKATTQFLNPLSLIKKPTQKHKKMINDILRYIYGKAPKKETPFPDSNGLTDYDNYLVQALDMKLNDPMPLIHKEPQENGFSLISMKHTELDEEYYRQVMKATNRNFSAAAKITGEKENTLRKNKIIKRLNIKE